MLLRRLLDGVPPEALLALINGQATRYPVLFDSASTGPMSRHSILVATDGDSLALRRDGVLLRNDAAQPAGVGFLGSLETWWAALRQSGAVAAGADGPWRGGFAVFAGYELAGEVEPRLRLPPSPEPWVAWALRTPAALVHDRSCNAVWAVAEADAADWLDRLEHDARSVAGPRPAPAPLPPWQITEDDPARYLAGTRQALEHIAAGDVYQLNLSRGWRAPLPPQIAADEMVAQLYGALRRANPAPFAVLARWRGLDILSSSPERLLSVEAGVASTRPIAGTRPRGASLASDLALAAELRSNAKERAEHIMLIDLERNDLGKVCEAGSVQVDELMALETYTHVHHIVSQVTGRLRRDRNALDALRALFPGGTITGCPKVRCMELIAQIEAGGRGAYTGSLGMLGRDGSADFNILIRTLTVHDGRVHGRAGAGIVADSDPARELAETRAKALGMLRALDLCVSAQGRSGASA